MKQSEIIKRSMEAAEAEYEAAYESMVTGSPDRAPDTLDRLWKVFWVSRGKALRDKVEELKEQYFRQLNREIEVGDGVTLHFYSDAEAHTVIARTAKTMKIQRDKAVRDPSFKPEWVPGGFSAICTNSEDQKWTYEPDPKGTITVCHWSEKHGRWQAGSAGSLRVSRGRHEHYDYNF